MVQVPDLFLPSWKLPAPLTLPWQWLRFLDPTNSKHHMPRVAGEWWCMEYLVTLTIITYNSQLCLDISLCMVILLYVLVAGGSCSIKYPLLKLIISTKRNTAVVLSAWLCYWTWHTLAFSISFWELEGSSSFFFMEGGNCPDIVTAPASCKCNEQTVNTVLYMWE